MWYFFFKQKTAYEMRISNWSSDVCSSDLPASLEPLAERLRRGILVVACVDRVGGRERRHRDFARRHRRDQRQRDVVVETDRLDDDLQPARDAAGDAVVDLAQ